MTTAYRTTALVGVNEKPYRAKNPGFSYRLVTAVSPCSCQEHAHEVRGEAVPSVSRRHCNCMNDEGLTPLLTTSAANDISAFAPGLKQENLGGAFDYRWRRVLPLRGRRTLPGSRRYLRESSLTRRQDGGGLQLFAGCYPGTRSDGVDKVRAKRRSATSPPTRRPGPSVLKIPVSLRTCRGSKLRNDGRSFLANPP